MESEFCENIGVEVLLNERLQYKGVIGTFAWSEDDSCWYGKILNTRHLITYKGDFFEDLKSEFKIVAGYVLENFDVQRKIRTKA